MSWSRLSLRLSVITFPFPSYSGSSTGDPIIYRLRLRIDLAKEGMDIIEILRSIRQHIPLLISERRYLFSEVPFPKQVEHLLVRLVNLPRPKLSGKLIGPFSLKQVLFPKLSMKGQNLVRVVPRLGTASKDRICLAMEDILILLIPFSFFIN